MQLHGCLHMYTPVCPSPFQPSGGSLRVLQVNSSPAPRGNGCSGFQDQGFTLPDRVVPINGTRLIEKSLSVEPHTLWSVVFSTPTPWCFGDPHPHPRVLCISGVLLHLCLVFHSPVNIHNQSWVMNKVLDKKQNSTK